MNRFLSLFVALLTMSSCKTKKINVTKEANKNSVIDESRPLLGYWSYKKGEKKQFELRNQIFTKKYFLLFI